MNTVLPLIDPAGRYELKEAAILLGVDRSTICRYRKAGLIRASIRRSNNRYVYLGSELIKLWKSIH